MTKCTRWVLGCAMLTMGLGVGGNAMAGKDWPTAGHDLENSRHQTSGKGLSAKKVADMKLRWAFNTVGDVTATPAVDGDYLFFPDSAGFLYKVVKATGELVWKKPIADYTGIAGDFAYATPAVTGNALILGNQSGKLLGAAFGQPNPQPARVFAVDKNTGAPLWTTQVDSTAMSFITQAAVVANGTAIVGVDSNEELVATFVPQAFWQWQFRGSVVALDVATGAIKWKTYTVPNGYYGGAVLGSTAAIDLKLNYVFITTGQNYMVPQAVLACLSAGGAPASCIAPSNLADSIIALDLATGAIRWASRGLDNDIWTAACGLNHPGFAIGPGFPGVYGNCPNGNPATAGPAYRFWQGPILFGSSGNNGERLVGAGQGSGKFWALSAKDGAPVWVTEVAPGGYSGGLGLGSATDGKSIYVAVANSGPTTNAGGIGALPWTLKDGTTTTAGGWAALDAESGAVLWTTKDPYNSRAEAPVSVAKGVVFGCNLAAGQGTMYALDAKTGNPLWSYDSGGACNAGPSIVDDIVFWGSGTFNGLGPKKVFAFGL